MTTPERRLAELLRAAPPPSEGLSADEVVRLAQRRSSAWLTAGAAAGVALLVLVVSVLAQHRTAPRAVGPASTTAASSPAATEAPSPTSAAPGGEASGTATAVAVPPVTDPAAGAAEVVAASWADPSRGWVLTSRSCGAGDICAQLRATSDAGRAWSSVRTPLLQTRQGAPSAGARLVDGHRGYLWAGDRTWFTADAGASWAQTGPAHVVSLDVRGELVVALTASGTDFRPCAGACTRTGTVVTGTVGSRTWRTQLRVGDGLGTVSAPEAGPIVVTSPPENPAGTARGGTLTVSYDAGAHWRTDSPCADVPSDVLSGAAGAGTRVAALCLDRSSGQSYVVSSAGPGRPYLARQQLSARDPNGPEGDLPLQRMVTIQDRFVAATGSASGQGEVPVRVDVSDGSAQAWREVFRRTVAATPYPAAAVLSSSGGVVTWIPDGLHAWRSLDGGLTWTTLRLPR